MERLTNKKEADAQRKEYEIRLAAGYPRNIPEERFLKLAAYEGTGLEPEEIKAILERYYAFRSAISDETGQPMVSWTRAGEICRAEKDGRLVVLPCKVGDAVYFPVAGRWDAATIDRIEIDSNGVRFGWVQYDVRPEVNELWDDGCFAADNIGKTVFLTREEAEAALKRGRQTMRLIDADALFDFLTDQLEEGVGFYSKGRNTGLNVARSALHDKTITPTITPPPNDPLTLEELREMDGEPVWIKAKHSKCFADVLHNVAKSEGRVYIRLINHWNLQESGYGKTWLAYRRKLEEGTK